MRIQTYIVLILIQKSASEGEMILFYFKFILVV